MRCVDSHCHLQMSPFNADRQDVLDRAKHELEWIAVVGDDLDASRRAVAMVGPQVYAIVGLHPYHASRYNDATERELQGMASDKGVIALGEMGLDYHNEFSPRKAQWETFERQLALAAALKKTAVIHSRSAEKDTLSLLRHYASSLSGCVMHCFGGDADFARQCLDCGCYISFAGNVTYPKAFNLQEAAKAVPQDRLLLETDAPYLAPQCVRGKRCEPTFVLHTLTFLAGLHHVSTEDLGEKTALNAYRVFDVNENAG